MFALIDTAGVVLEVAPTDAPVVGDARWIEVTAGQVAKIGDIYDPETSAFVTPSPSSSQLMASAAAAIQAHLDAVAGERRYDNIQTAVSYRDDPNPLFSAEGQAAFLWRSSVWTAALVILTEVEAGERPAPDDADLIAALPAMVWPSS